MKIMEERAIEWKNARSDIDLQIEVFLVKNPGLYLVSQFISILSLFQFVQGKEVRIKLIAPSVLWGNYYFSYNYNKKKTYVRFKLLVYQHSVGKGRGLSPLNFCRRFDP